MFLKGSWYPNANYDLEDERRYMERQIAEIEQANKQGASRKTWEIINGICGKLVPCPVVKVKSSMAKSSNPHKFLDEWWKYFSNLLNFPPVIGTREIPQVEADLEIKTDDFDRAETDKAIKGSNNYKAPRFDYNIKPRQSSTAGMN